MSHRQFSHSFVLISQALVIPVFVFSISTKAGNSVDLELSVETGLCKDVLRCSGML